MGFFWNINIRRYVYFSTGEFTEFALSYFPSLLCFQYIFNFNRNSKWSYVKVLWTYSHESSPRRDRESTFNKWNIFSRITIHARSVLFLSRLCFALKHFFSPLRSFLALSVYSLESKPRNNPCAYLVRTNSEQKQKRRERKYSKLLASKTSQSLNQEVW